MQIGFTTAIERLVLQEASLVRHYHHSYSRYHATAVLGGG